MKNKEKKAELIVFGNQLCEMRESKDLSQDQLAEMLGVDRRQISRYETGAAEMGALLYAKMQNVLSVKVDKQLASFLQVWEALPPESRSKLIDLAEIMKTANEKK